MDWANSGLGELLIMAIVLIPAIILDRKKRPGGTRSYDRSWRDWQ